MDWWYPIFMLEIFCAMFYEAKPIIQDLQLKKKNRIPGADSYVNEGETIRLTVTGTGKIATASVVSLILQEGMASFALWFGCGAFKKSSQENIYIANQIKDIDTKRTFYPDMVYQTPFKETGFLTGSAILNKQDLFLNNTDLFLVYDMESSAFFEAANRFLSPHQISCVRFKSDEGDSFRVTKETIEQAGAKVYPILKTYIEMLLCYRTESIEIPVDLIHAFAQQIHASVTMQNQIEQLVRYALLTDKDCETYLRNVMRTEVTTKEEGKEVLHAFEQWCLQY